MLFPDGFTIDKENRKVLTDQVNEYLVANDWITGDYETIEIKKGQEPITFSVRGGRPDNFGTIFKDLQLLVIFEGR